MPQYSVHAGVYGPTRAKTEIYTVGSSRPKRQAYGKCGPDVLAPYCVVSSVTAATTSSAVRFSM